MKQGIIITNVSPELPFLCSTDINAILYDCYDCDVNAINLN